MTAIPSAGARAFSNNTGGIFARNRPVVLVDRVSSSARARARARRQTGERRWSASLLEITASAAIDRAANTYLASGCALSED